jgi:hypothetical protein
LSVSVKATLTEEYERAQQADGEHHPEGAETHLQGSALAAYALIALGASVLIFASI